MNLLREVEITMYLSCLILNPRYRQLVTNCQKMHTTLLTAFPSLVGVWNKARKQSKILHRVEFDPEGRTVVLVQSKDKPDWGRLDPKYFRNTSNDPRTVEQNPAVMDVNDVYANLRLNQVFLFRLRANPTRNRQSDKMGRFKKNGTRIPITSEKVLFDWLANKGKEGGFVLIPVQLFDAVPDVRITFEGDVTGWADKGENDFGSKWRRLTFRSVLFDGHLRITNVERFLRTLEVGIGSAKAYGFGLLSIAFPRV